MNSANYRRQPYIRKLEAARKAGLIPATPFVVIDVRHDADCPLLTGQGPCACNPDLVLPNRHERRAKSKGGA